MVVTMAMVPKMVMSGHIVLLFAKLSSSAAQCQLNRDYPKV